MPKQSKTPGFIVMSFCFMILGMVAYPNKKAPIVMGTIYAKIILALTIDLLTMSYKKGSRRVLEALTVWIVS
jgi:hypothetical protein